MRGGVPPGQVASQLTLMHTHMNSILVANFEPPINLSNMHAGLWEEAGAPGESPRKQRHANSKQEVSS